MKQGQTFCNGQDVLAIVFVSTEIRETLFVVVKNNADYLEDQNKIHTFATLLRNQSDMVGVVQLVRASDCGSECRGFESHQPPQDSRNNENCSCYSFSPAQACLQAEGKEWLTSKNWGDTS